jgi:glycosyltransferase involved in cell wall biosynthesis
MKNIAMLLSNAFRPDPRVYKEALSLVQAGYNVNVICWDRNNEYPQKEIIQGINIIRLKIQSKYSAGSQQIFYLPLFLVNAIHYLEQIKPDIVHCHDLDTTIAGAWYSKLHKIPWIFDAHECYPEQIGPQVNRLIYIFLKWLERLMANKANQVITIGNALASHFQLSDSKISIVGNYPDLDTFNTSIEGITRQRLGIPINAYVVSYIGGFTLARAILPFIYGAEIFKAVTILLAGDGPQAEKIKEIISGHKNIIYLGWVPQEHVPTYINLSDVIYYGLNQKDGNSQYSSPNALFNAMAAGKPILTTAVGEIAHIVKVEKCGFVISDATPECIAQGLKGLSDISIRQSLGENAKKAAYYKYNWSTAKNNLLQIYIDLLKS